MITFPINEKLSVYRWLSFFPMIFCELGKQSRVVVDTEYMTGMEYCNELIVALCNTNVASEDAVAFTAVLRELKIPATTLTKLVDCYFTDFFVSKKKITIV